MFKIGDILICHKTSSHWLYDKDDKWIAFPKADDYDKITKIMREV